MKLWLASYPRSGNTFLRSILSQSFGIGSSSVYAQENAGLEGCDWLATSVGYLARVTDSDPDKWVAIKTHDLPADTLPAIYVVRDGRAAITSYFHFLNTYERELESNENLLKSYLRSLRRNWAPGLRMKSLIRGQEWPGSWSEHYRAWSPETRPNTLLLRYEDVLASPDETCTRIAKFLGIAQIKPFEQNFRELQSRNPTFFRAADNRSSIAELANHRALFDDLHGELMEELGYSSASWIADAA
jgi:hypothetical protein